MISYSVKSSNLVARPHISHRGVPVVASETLVALIRVCFWDDAEEDEYDVNDDDDEMEIAWARS